MAAKVIVAVQTPFDEAWTARFDLLTAHCQWLLDAGVDDLAVFGTTGFGPTIAVEHRMAMLDHLVGAGIAAERIIVGATAASLSETVRLARHGVTVGCRRSFVMPPFFFRHGGPDGIEAWYRGVLDGVGDSGFGLYLYNIPILHGAPIASSLLRVLDADYPGNILGMKDSSGDWSYLKGLLEDYPTHEIYTGIEPMLPQAVDLGGGGAISGIANLAPGLVRRLVAANDTPDRRAAVTAVQHLVDVLPAGNIVEALAGVTARLSGEPAWGRLAPPLVVPGDAVMDDVVAAYQPHWRG